MAGIILPSKHLPKKRVRELFKTNKFKNYPIEINGTSLQVNPVEAVGVRAQGGEYTKQTNQQYRNASI